MGNNQFGKFGLRNLPGFQHLRVGFQAGTLAKKCGTENQQNRNNKGKANHALINKKPKIEKSLGQTAKIRLMPVCLEALYLAVGAGLAPARSSLAPARSGLCACPLRPLRLLFQKETQNTASLPLYRCWILNRNSRHTIQRKKICIQDLSLPKNKNFPLRGNLPFQARALCLLVPRGI